MQNPSLTQKMHAKSRHLSGILFGFALMMAAGLPGACRASECDYPVFILNGGVSANVMLLFDNSFSMNTPVFHPDYDPNTTYAGAHIPDAVYYVAVTGIYNINGKDATLVNAPNGQPGQYPGNYLNWIYWVATDLQRSDLPLYTRLDQAQLVVHDFVDRTTNVRFGLALFNGDDGADIVAPCGSTTATILNEIDNIVADAWSPLGEALEDLADYFQSTGAGAPIVADCQKSFIVIITDGYPTMDLDVSPILQDADGDGRDPGDCASIGSTYDNSYDCSDFADDVAFYMNHNDMRPDMAEFGESSGSGQNVAIFAIGLGLDAPLLADIAANGDGLYLPVFNGEELMAGLNAVKADIMLRVASGSAVAVVSSETQDGSFIYRTKFSPQDWSGFLEAVDLADMPTGNFGAGANGAGVLWDAGDELARRSADDRTIFTALGTSVENFVDSNTGDLMGPMGIADAETCAIYINWTRGESEPGPPDDGGSGTGSSGMSGKGGSAPPPEPDPADGLDLRSRTANAKLGDIIRSTPVVVGNPTFFMPDEDWQLFASGEATREKVIYVGANDGMLHCFRAEDGFEKWAFIPEYALPKLQEIARTDYCHLFTVDLPCKVADVKLGSTWKTVLVGGAGQGGSHYFALDVTDPDNPVVMWQTDLPRDLPFASEARFATLDDQPVVLVGSGLDEIDGEAYLHEIDLATGALMHSVLLSATPGVRNKATSIGVVDRNVDGNSDLGYIGTLAGDVHRIKFNNSTDPFNWTITALYSGTQEITAQPSPALAETGFINVYFGTGTFLVEPDLADITQQSFICVFDKGDGAENPTLIDQTDTIHTISSADDGWFFDLIEEPGERVVEPAAIVAGEVFFTSFAPNSEPCRAGGESWLYHIKYETGEEVDPSDETKGRGQYQYRGGGIASRPVIDIFNETVIVQNSSLAITIESIGNIIIHIAVKSWQENFAACQNDTSSQQPTP